MHQHQDWLEERRFKELVASHQKLAANEPFKDLIRLPMEFGNDVMRGILTRNPGKYPALLNALAKLAAMGLSQERPPGEVPVNAEPAPITTSAPPSNEK